MDLSIYTFQEIRKGLLASCSGFYWIFMGEKEPGYQMVDAAPSLSGFLVRTRRKTVVKLPFFTSLTPMFKSYHSSTLPPRPLLEKVTSASLFNASSNGKTFSPFEEALRRGTKIVDHILWRWWLCLMQPRVCVHAPR